MRFVCSESHILRERPSLFFQQAANQPNTTAPAMAAKQRWETGCEDRPWIRWVNRPDTSDPCILTIAGFPGWVADCAYSPCGSRIACASETSVLILDGKRAAS